MLRTLLVLALALAPLTARAQTYRCVDKNGNKHYSQTVPEACVGRLVELLNSEGVVIKRILPPPTATEVEEQKAAAEKTRLDAEAAKEQARRDKALLASYTSVQDIEDARTRARADNDRMIGEITKRIAALEKRRAEEQKGLQAYAGKKAPERLTEDLGNTESDLTMQKGALAARQQEAAKLDARFDADKKRFLELTGAPAARQ